MDAMVREGLWRNRLSCDLNNKKRLSQVKIWENSISGRMGYERKKTAAMATA